MVQWLRLRASTEGGAGWIPGQGTKISQATWHSQKKKKSYPHMYICVYIYIFVNYLNYYKNNPSALLLSILEWLLLSWLEPG